MSADLLRRAASKLREYASAAPPGPWKTGGGCFRPNELVVAPDRPVVEFAGGHDGASTAEYVALMHPPVALALADWLNGAAETAEMIGPDRFAVATARAVLREG